jgi:hypothetical protein
MVDVADPSVRGKPLGVKPFEHRPSDLGDLLLIGDLAANRIAHIGGVDHAVGVGCDRRARCASSSGSASVRVISRIGPALENDATSLLLQA